jgi:hypothetical protein
MNDEAIHRPGSGNVIIGKDILELLSSAMYVDPLTVFREYVQNATDAIDGAQAKGHYNSGKKPRIDIILDPLRRSATVRDNGIGIPARDVIRRLTAFGASRKRGLQERGFRGVGRLAGLGYCQELFMRTHAIQDKHITEVRWDCVRLKELLLDTQYIGTLDQIVQDVVTARKILPDDLDTHFFEIEMRGVVRLKNDVLLNEDEVADYLSETCPVPFDPSFQFGCEIQQYLKLSNIDSGYRINVNRRDRPLYRLLINSFSVSQFKADQFTTLELFALPSLGDQNAAVGWILHHEYLGALPKRLGFRGLRLRMGNIQIGTDNVFEELFPEPRFNAWCVGEIHALSPKLVPNGRRDSLEQNGHYVGLQSQIVPYARKIARLCREKSLNRQRKSNTSPALMPLALASREEQLLKVYPKSKAATYRELIHMIYELRGDAASALVTDLLKLALKRHKQLRTA